MWSEQYFATGYFGKRYFGPIITDDVTIQQSTYWGPAYFGARYFSTRYFARGDRILPQVHEIEGEDELGVISDTVVVLEVNRISAGDTILVVLDELVPLFEGQEFLVSDVAPIEISESSSVDKEIEATDDASFNIVETAVAGVVLSVEGSDVAVFSLLEEAEDIFIQAYYIDKPFGVGVEGFYKDRNR